MQRTLETVKELREYFVMELKENPTNEFLFNLAAQINISRSLDIIHAEMESSNEASNDCLSDIADELYLLRNQEISFKVEFA